MSHASFNPFTIEGILNRWRPLGKLCPNAFNGCLELFFSGHKMLCGKDNRIINRLNYGVIHLGHPRHSLKGIPKEFNAELFFLIRNLHFNGIAHHLETAGFAIHLISLILNMNQFMNQIFAAYFLPNTQGKC